MALHSPSFHDSHIHPTSYLKEADNLLAATKISSAAAHTRPRLPFVYHENDQHVPAASVVASAEAASHHEEHLSLGAEEAARRELAKKRSLNFDSKPPLGSNDSFGDYHLVKEKDDRLFAF